MIFGEYSDIVENDIFTIRYFPIPIIQYVLGGSLHKNNTNHLVLGLYHAPVNWISIVLMQITPQNELYEGFVKTANAKISRRLQIFVLWGLAGMRNCPEKG